MPLAISFVVLLSSAALFAQQSSTWKFDRLDKIGGHAVTVEGHPRIIDTPKGKAIEFNGNSDALFFDVHPLAGAKTFTFEVVFRPDAGGRPEQRFFHLQQTGADTRLLLETRLVGDQWYLDSYAHSAAGSQTLVDKSKLHPLGQWMHAASVYDGHEFRHYVNGVLQGKAEVTLSPQGPGRTSAGVRINRIDWFKGAIRTARFTPQALAPEKFLKP